MKRRRYLLTSGIATFVTVMAGFVAAPATAGPLPPPVASALLVAEHRQNCWNRRHGWQGDPVGLH